MVVCVMYNASLIGSPFGCCQIVFEVASHIIKSFLPAPEFPTLIKRNSPETTRKFCNNTLHAVKYLLAHNIIYMYLLVSRERRRVRRDFGFSVYNIYFDKYYILCSFRCATFTIYVYWQYIRL